MQKKIAYLGMGIWGYCLAVMLARNGHRVVGWSIDTATIEELKRQLCHPRLPALSAPSNLTFTHHLSEALEGADVVVEAVTSSGIRSVLTEMQKLCRSGVPIVITSKGIEQGSGLLLSEIGIEIFGPEAPIGCLSGPSIADEVARGHPTSVVCSSYDSETMATLHQLFVTPTFRVYPNSDIHGVELGGALKNIIAIACGASDGLGFGDNAKASLMTRGLHEMRKLAPCKGAKPDTLNGLAGMGDLCVTCLSPSSRNYRFGKLLAQGATVDEAKRSIGMVVEGAYTAKAALQLAHAMGVEMPITEMVYRAIYDGMGPKEAVKHLLQRATKEEIL